MTKAAKLTGQGWDSRPTGRAPLPMARLGRRESIVGGGDRSSSPAHHLQNFAAPSARKVRSDALQFFRQCQIARSTRGNLACAQSDC